MNRNDFEIIADVIRTANPISRTARLAIAQTFASRLALLNPRFRKDVFYIACGVTYTD